MPSVNNDSFVSSFPILTFSILFSCLIALNSTSGTGLVKAPTYLQFVLYRIFTNLCFRP